MEKQKSVFQANLAELPILKNGNFGEVQLTKTVDTFRKGEFTLYQAIKLAVFGALAWAIWTYVLPPIFVAIGQMMAVAATGVLIVGLIIMAPVIVKAIRLFTRSLHKSLIRYDPFAQLEIERQKLIQMVNTFRVAKGKIAGLKQDMEIEALKSEKDAEFCQTKIITLQGKAEKFKSEMDSMVQERGVIARGDDDYVNNASELQKVLAEAQRMSNKLVQSKDFVQKYGSRANIMKKMGQKLIFVETAMDIKVLDFDSTIEMLKKDYSFAQKSSEATSAAKGAMLFSKGWEFDYALEVVQNTIAADIAITSGNLKDIDMLTSQYSMDSDELYTNMSLIADKIKIGEDLIPTAKQYNNPDYILSSSDRAKSGGFQELF